MTTVGVYTACWGKEYAEFIPQWWRGFLSLNRKPDEVLLGVLGDDEAGLVASVPAGVDAKIVQLPEGLLTPPLNLAERWDFLSCQGRSDWFVAVPIDDELLPGALDEIDAADEAGADILIDSIQYRHDGRIWKGHWDCRHIATQMPAPQGCPMRTDVYKRVGQKNEYRWADWILQIDLAKAGVKPYFASTVRYIFDAGIGRKTMSTPGLDRSIREAGDREVREYAASVGF